MLKTGIIQIQSLDFQSYHILIFVVIHTFLDIPESVCQPKQLEMLLENFFQKISESC